jgi:hypothetical protein
MWTRCTPRSSVFMVVSAKITVFWDMTHRTFMDRSKHLGQAFYLNGQGTQCTINCEDRSSRFVHKIHTHLQNYTVWHILWGSHSIDIETGRSSRSYHLLTVMTQHNWTFRVPATWCNIPGGQNHIWHHITEQDQTKKPTDASADYDDYTRTQMLPSHRDVLHYWMCHHHRVLWDRCK